MDKKNLTIGILLLAAAFAVMFLGPHPAVTPPTTVTPSSQTTSPTPVQPSTAGPANTTISAASPESTAATTTTTAAAPKAPTESPEVRFKAAVRAEGEEFVSLSNSLIEVRFTNHGGAIAEVVLKNFPEAKTDADPYILNELRSAPILSLLDYPGADRNSIYTVVSRTDTSITWRTVAEGQVEVTRTYTINTGIEDALPYSITNETTFRNLTGQAVNTPSLVIGVGTVDPVSRRDPAMNLDVGAYDGSSLHLVARSQMDGGGFFAMLGLANGAPKPLIDLQRSTVWATTKNQFFTTVLKPSERANDLMARRVEFPLVPGEPEPRFGIAAEMLMNSRHLEAGASSTMKFDLYAGPKEYSRLVKFGTHEDHVDEVMQLGWFTAIAMSLLTLLRFLHNHLFAWSNWAWGFAIITTTLLIRGLMWPVTAAGARSAKRMAKISAPMKAIQEKYKDNKAKQQEETMKLFREHKVNPVAGCLPLFLQIPIFYGLYRMLQQGATELRFAEFLWIRDLSAADTVGMIGNFPINPLAVLMGASMYFQMKMTPAPTTDNSSAKMMKFMPIMFSVMCYNLSSGLTLYWTASNCFSIFQQWYTNRTKDPVGEAADASAADRAKPVRDAKVTTLQDRKKKR